MWTIDHLEHALGSGDETRQSIVLLKLIQGPQIREKPFTLPQQHEILNIQNYLCSYYQKRFLFEMFGEWRA